MAREGGFTLLELLIVLVLLGATAAIAVPGLQRTYEAVSRSGERAEVIRQIEGLPLLARAQGEAVSIEAGDVAGLASRLTMPQGWRVAPVDPIRVRANGLCADAQVRVEGPGIDEQWRLRAPGCSVVEQN